MSLDLTDDKSTLVQVMAWCRQATSHYLSQCWPRSLSPCGVTKPQWANLQWLSGMLVKWKHWWKVLSGSYYLSITVCFPCSWGRSAYPPSVRYWLAFRPALCWAYRLRKGQGHVLRVQYGWLQLCPVSVQRAGGVGVGVVRTPGSHPALLVRSTHRPHFSTLPHSSSSPCPATTARGTHLALEHQPPL